MQYFILYVLGLLKAQIITIPMIVNPTDTVDRVVYHRFLANMLSPDEVLPLYSP